MPQLALRINTPVSDAAVDLMLTELTEAVAVSTGKPVEYVAIDIDHSVKMAFGGSKDPACLATFLCIGEQNLERNTAVSAATAAALEKHCGIPKSRYFIRFDDVDRTSVGWKAATFANLPTE